jgi:hypothetical protein
VTVCKMVAILAPNDIVNLLGQCSVTLMRVLCINAGVSSPLVDRLCQILFCIAVRVLVAAVHPYQLVCSPAQPCVQQQP